MTSPLSSTVQLWVAATGIGLPLQWHTALVLVLVRNQTLYVYCGMYSQLLICDVFVVSNMLAEFLNTSAACLLQQDCRRHRLAVLLLCRKGQLLIVR